MPRGTLPPANCPPGRNIPIAVQHQTIHSSFQSLVKTPLFLGFNNLPPELKAWQEERGGSRLAVCRGLSLQWREQPGKGARHSLKRTGRGLPCRKHQPRRQQHCSHGDRKERTRLDQSRLEQTPPTITIIHNPHLPPSTAASHIYPGKNSGQVQYPRSQKSSNWG